MSKDHIKFEDIELKGLKDYAKLTGFLMFAGLGIHFATGWFIGMGFIILSVFFMGMFAGETFLLLNIGWVEWKRSKKRNKVLWSDDND